MKRGRAKNSFGASRGWVSRAPNAASRKLPQFISFLGKIAAIHIPKETHTHTPNNTRTHLFLFFSKKMFGSFFFFFSRDCVFVLFGYVLCRPAGAQLVFVFIDCDLAPPAKERPL